MGIPKSLHSESFLQIVPLLKHKNTIYPSSNGMENHTSSYLLLSQWPHPLCTVWSALSKPHFSNIWRSRDCWGNFSHKNSHSESSKTTESSKGKAGSSVSNHIASSGNLLSLHKSAQIKVIKHVKSLKLNLAFSYSVRQNWIKIFCINNPNKVITLKCPNSVFHIKACK